MHVDGPATAERPDALEGDLTSEQVDLTAGAATERLRYELATLSRDRLPL